ncbi:MAG: SPASM domain-containing protein [Tannerellaceae bacterium]|nr:SPASM domain-containing protein [Tannerellaceae bacterium]
MKCQAACKYCFGPHEGSFMARETIDAISGFIALLPEKRDMLRIIFHGGEPLLAGYEWFDYALCKLSETGTFAYSIQSNLWELNQRFVDLFAKYHVSVSTSLDGDRDICDSQRGRGYFDRTIAGIHLLRDNAIDVSAIATIMPDNVERVPEILQFFDKEDLPFTIRGAVPSMQHGYDKDNLYVTSHHLQRMLNQTFYYLANDPRHRIRDAEAMVQTVLRNRGSICTFGNCLGKYAAISPEGDIYSCQRFCGITEFSLGNVYTTRNINEIVESEAYIRMAARYGESSLNHCRECSHFQYCKGGCVYSLLTADKYGMPHPYCNEDEEPHYFYKKMFDKIRRRLASEVSAQMQGIECNTPYLYMAGDYPHPASLWENRRTFRLARQWAKTKAPRNAFVGKSRCDNLFLNITDKCPLHCTHCSVEAGAGNVEMDMGTIIRVMTEAVDMDYAEISLNGGEPFEYKNFELLLDKIGSINRGRTRFALFTNLYVDIDDNLAAKALSVFNEITVSIDGNREEHDARRGRGAFDRSCSNIRRLVSMPSDCRLSIRGTLTQEQRLQGVPEQIRAIAYDLGISSVYIHGVLPIGRAKRIADIFTICPPQIEARHLYRPLRLRNTCGIGYNLHISPAGDVYPCWALVDNERPMGNVRDGLRKVTSEYLSPENTSWTVDAVEKCKSCEARYLCGGICRGYCNTDCSALRDAYLSIGEMLKGSK